MLEDTLGRSWLDSADPHAEHPILKRWASGGAPSFLELNGLGDDVRVVRAVPGFETVLHDLKNVSMAASAWHVVHGAALFERHTPGSIVQFFPQTGASLPDFLLRWQRTEIAVEAKLLTGSEAEDVFSRYGEGLARRILAGVLGPPGIHPIVTVVVKDSRRMPSPDDVLSVLANARRTYAGSPLVVRAQTFNSFLEPPAQDLSAFSEYRSCHVLGRKSEDEDLRVVDRGKKASAQLRAYEGGSPHAGLFLLGVTRLVEPLVVAGLLQTRFARGFFRGISGAILVERGTHLGPPVRSVLDVIASVRNTASARVPLPDDLGISPRGLYAKFAPSEGVPAYRISFAEGRLKSEQGGALPMADLRVLTPDLLQ